jgi:hypothetical protein
MTAVSVRGALMRQAEHRATVTDGHVVVFLVDPGKGLPFEVSVALGQGPNAALRAETVARGYSKGCRVYAEGEHLRVRRDHDVACVVLGGETRVLPL